MHETVGNTTDQASDLRFLASEAGQVLLSELAQDRASNLNSVTLVAELRARDLAPEQVSAALTQAKLRQKAVSKFGERAERMLFTEAALEQATRLIVAKTHAQRIASRNISHVADLGCGIGAESIALAEAGLTVHAVELDPITAEMARYNLREHPTSTVTVADAEQVDVSHVDAVFLDPARRTAGHRNTQRLTDSSEYSPSLDFAFGLAERMPVAIKLGPGFDRSEIPQAAHAQWTSVDGEAVEMMLWFGALATPGVTRSALVLRGNSLSELTAAVDSADAPVRELGEYLFEPDPAIIRARLIGDLARSLGWGMLDERIAYVTGDIDVSSPFARGFRIREVLPASEARLKKALRERGIGRLEIKKRGMDVDPAQLRKRLALRGDSEATLILTRAQVNGRQKRVALLADRLTDPLT